MNYATHKMKLFSLACLGLVLLFSSLPASAGEYGAWQAFPHFDGLEFRVRKASYNEAVKKWEWHVLFRNNYKKTIHFACELAEDGAKNVPVSARLSLKAGETGTRFGDNASNWKLLKSSERIEVFIGKVRFGDDDSGPYVKP